MALNFGSNSLINSSFEPNLRFRAFKSPLNEFLSNASLHFVHFGSVGYFLFFNELAQNAFLVFTMQFSIWGLKIQCLRLKILAQTLKIRLFIEAFKLCHAVFYRSSGNRRAYSSLYTLVKGLWYDIIHAKFKHFARIHLL